MPDARRPRRDARPRPHLRRARGVGAGAARPPSSARGCCARRPRCGICSRSRWSTIAAEDPSSPDARWCLGHYFAELGERFEERFDPGRTLPADGSDLVPPAGAFLIARFSGQPAGCGALKTLRPNVGEIMRMWVDRAHRGLGIGARILDALEARAAALGHHTVRLYTNRSLAEAKAMYRRRRLRRDRPLQRRPLRRPLVREAAGSRVRPVLEANAGPGGPLDRLSPVKQLAVASGT